MVARIVQIVTLGTSGGGVKRPYHLASQLARQYLGQPCAVAHAQESVRVAPGTPPFSLNERFAFGSQSS